MCHRSSGKAINSKIHKYSLYHRVRQDPKPIPGQIMDQMFTENSSRGKTTLPTEESRVTPVPQEHDCIDRGRRLREEVRRNKPGMEVCKL